MLGHTGTSRHSGLSPKLSRVSRPWNGEEDNARDNEEDDPKDSERDT